MPLMLLLGDASLEHIVESVLHQQLCVLVDCISQPYEAVSRLGCSCIRYDAPTYTWISNNNDDVILSARKSLQQQLTSITEI